VPSRLERRRREAERQRLPTTRDRRARTTHCDVAFVGHRVVDRADDRATADFQSDHHREGWLPGNKVRRAVQRINDPAACGRIDCRIWLHLLGEDRVVREGGGQPRDQDCIGSEVGIRNGAVVRLRIHPRALRIVPRNRLPRLPHRPHQNIYFALIRHSTLLEIKTRGRENERTAKTQRTHRTQRKKRTSEEMRGKDGERVRCSLNACLFSLSFVPFFASSAFSASLRFSPVSPWFRPRFQFSAGSQRETRARSSPIL